MVHVVVRKQEVVILILDFLRQNGLFRAMRGLEVETGLRADLFGKEIQHIRDMILDGNWDGAERFLRPYQRRLGEDYGNILFLLRKQRFLEAVEYQHLNPAVVQLVDGLKDLEHQCSPQEFNELCYLITLPRICEHPRYVHWTPMKGRHSTFEAIYPVIEMAFGSSAQGQDFIPNRLERLLKQSLSFQIARWRTHYPQAAPLPDPLYATLLEDFGYAEPKEVPLMTQAALQEMKSIGIEFVNMEPYDEVQDGEAIDQPTSPKIDSNDFGKPARQESPRSRSPSPVGRHVPLKSPTQRNEEVGDRRLKSLSMEPSRHLSKKPEPLNVGHTTPKATPRTSEQPNSKDSTPRNFPPSRSLLEAGNIQKLRPVAIYKDANIIRSMSIHPRLACVAVGGNSKALSIVSLECTEGHEGLQDLRLIQKFPDQHQGSIYAVGWNSTGRLLATGSNDQKIVVVGLEDDFLLDKNKEAILRGHDGTIRDLAFSPITPGLLISGGGGDRRFRVWDAIRGRCLHPHDGHTGTITSVGFNKDGSLMGSASEDGTIRLWDARTPKCTLTISPNNGEISSIAFSTSHNIITAAFANSSCFMIDVTTGRTFYEIRRHNAACSSVDYFPGGDWFLTSSYDCSVNAIPTELTMSGRGDLGSLVKQFNYHEDKVLQVRCHPTRISFVSSCADRTVVFWDS